MTQAVGRLSGGQRQCVAVGRAAAFAQHVVIMDEAHCRTRRQGGPTWCSNLIRRVRDRGPAGDPDQPQHAARVRGCRPDPRRAPWAKRAAVLNPKKIT